MWCNLINLLTLRKHQLVWWRRVHLICISTTVPYSRVRLKLVHRVVCVCCVCVMSSSSSKSSSSSLRVRRCLLPSSLQMAIARADAAEKHVRLAEAHCRDAMSDIAESRSHIRIYMAENAHTQKKKDKKNKRNERSLRQRRKSARRNVTKTTMTRTTMALVERCQEHQRDLVQHVSQLHDDSRDLARFWFTCEISLANVFG